MIYEVIMLDVLAYMFKQGLATQNKELFPCLDESNSGLPNIHESKQCSSDTCNICVGLCPNNAIAFTELDLQKNINLDLGSCIGCGLCIDNCPDSIIIKNLSTKTAVTKIEDLILSNSKVKVLPYLAETKQKGRKIFKDSLFVRVISTGCSACDLEINAASNPIFDMERFGISIVASPRQADVLLVTGPCSKAMHDALKRTYEAMASPKLVIACGTCAISGGIHKNGYSEANGLNSILNVDIFIPGCPPHPWSIIYGLFLAMGKLN